MVSVFRLADSRIALEIKLLGMSVEIILIVLTEVEIPAQCEWHYSLAEILDCMWRKQAEQQHAFIVHCFLIVGAI